MNLKLAASSFLLKPKGVHFETQDAQEEVLILMRAHPITNFSWILGTIILILLPVFILPVVFTPIFASVKLPLGYYAVLPMIWYLGVFGFVIVNFLQWYFNIYIVTNKRVVDVDWINLLYKKISSANLEKIQDVTYKQGGIVGSFFNYGNVNIQTAGTEPNFEFTSIPTPDKVVREINGILENHRKKI